MLGAMIIALVVLGLLTLLVGTDETLNEFS